MIKILITASCLLLAQIVVAQTCNKDTVTASTPDSRFVVYGDEVTDTDTGLIRQRCSLGQTGSDCNTGSATTYSWQQALQAASAPWRLPNVKELRSIVEEQCYSPASNLTVFPNTVSSSYWTASPYTRGSGYAWNVYFGYGCSQYGSRSYDQYVRLVRGGQ